MRTLHVICGPAGAGKTSHGQTLAAELGAALIDIDVCTERLVRLVNEAYGLPAADRDSGRYKELLRAPVYETLWDIAKHNLAHADCVVVGPFTQEVKRPDWPEALCARTGAADVVVHFVTCSDATRRARIESRANPRDAQKLESWDAYAAASRMQPPVFPHRLVDSDAW